MASLLSASGAHHGCLSSCFFSLTGSPTSRGSGSSRWQWWWWWWCGSSGPNSGSGRRWWWVVLLCLGPAEGHCSAASRGVCACLKARGLQACALCARACAGSCAVRDLSVSRCSQCCSCVSRACDSVGPVHFELRPESTDHQAASSGRGDGNAAASPTQSMLLNNVCQGGRTGSTVIQGAAVAAQYLLNLGHRQRRMKVHPMFFQLTRNNGFL